MTEKKEMDIIISPTLARALSKSLDGKLYKSFFLGRTTGQTLPIPYKKKKKSSGDVKTDCPKGERWRDGEQEKK